MGNHREYDSEPVKYCSKCYSLKIKYEDAIDAEWCADCGSSDILEAPVEEWEEKYKQRYGHKFVTKNEDPKKSLIFKMSFKELKYKVSDSPSWRKIIHAIYPRFPGGLGRVDSILLFFDKIVNDGKVDDLRMLLLKWRI